MAAQPTVRSQNEDPLMSHWESTGKSNDWYTPKYVFDALGCVFDIDVAGKPCIANYVPTHSIIEKDSLNQEWGAFVWMNPPFGGRNGLVPWMDKFFSNGNGIALTPDRTSAPWFQQAWKHSDLVMFTPKISFYREDGTLGESPSNGNALWAMGSQACAALDRASRPSFNGPGLGVMALPMRGH